MSKKIKLLLGMGLLLICGWLSGGSASATTYSVTNTNDSGAGSLRQAMLDANADSTAPHTIDFAIPGSGQQTIDLSSSLPALTRQTLVDGKTQSGDPLFCDESGSTEPPRVVLRNVSGSPMWLYADSGGENSEIRGLAFGPDIIVRASEGAHINCNYFGTSEGLSVNGSSQHSQPYFIVADSPNSVITDNVFANIDGVASYFGAINPAAGSTTIQHNFFNVTATGVSITGSHYNFSALYASGGTVLFGGTNTDEANTVSGYSYGVVGLDNVTALGNVMLDTGAPLRTYDSTGDPRNAPIIRSSIESSGNTTLEVELNDTYPVGTYRLEVFRNPTRRGNGFVPFDNPATDDALHGLETTELAGYVVVEKTNSTAQTLTATIAATNVTFPTVTATVQNPDTSLGGTSPLGYQLFGEDPAVSLATNLGAQKCFEANTTGDWTVTVTNDGTEPMYEFSILFRHAAVSSGAESQVDFDGVTTTGTATRTDYVGNYDATSGYVQGSVLFWEGELLPGESVGLHFPVSYSANDVYSLIININSAVPADAFSGTRMGNYLQQSAAAGNFQTGLVLNCAYATDLSVETRVGDAGVIPGSGGSYVITYKNEGELDVLDKPAFSSPIDPTSMNTISYFALDTGVTPVSASMPGVSVCSFFDPDQVGSSGPTADTSGCEVLCIDTALIDGAGFAELTEDNGFGALIMCYQTVGVPAGGSRSLTLQVAADSTVSESTRFRAFYSDFSSYYGVFSGSVLVPENAPFDNDVLGMMAFFQTRAVLTGASLNVNPYELLVYPINNSSRLIGIAGQTSGEQPDGSDAVSGEGVSPDVLLPSGGTLAESGLSVQMMIGGAISMVGAVWLVQQRRHRHYIVVAH